MNTLLDVKNLTVDFKTRAGLVTAISDIFLTIKPSETVCLVGESGSGKSVTSKTIMRLIDHDNGVISNGQIQFEKDDLVHLSTKELNEIRGKKIAMIFQEASAAFDPVFTIGSQLVETIRKHTRLSKKKAWEKGQSLLEKVGLSEPEIRMKQYPNELSGGMLQRAMIAMALSCEPDLLIADEPTTALDVTIQAQIIQLLKEIKEEHDMAILLITHDLGVAAQLADRIVVMYAGKIVEEATVQQLFEKPHHPYSRGLLQSIPKSNSASQKRLSSIEGSIPSLADMPTGCRFSPRCQFATDKCRRESPSLESINGRESACWYIEELIDRPDWFNEDDEIIEQVIKKEPEIDRKTLFEIRALSKYYPLKQTRKKLKAVNDVSFSIKEGETFGLVGESGSGKSTLGRTILQLEKVTSGDILYRGQSLLKLKGAAMRKMRKNMQMIFQDPYGSIDPRWTIGEVIAEPLKTHFKGQSSKEREAKVKELLQLVGLNPEWVSRYPHEFSGGQRQRIGIARAIAINPSFILADEAVSALDVSVQAQIINLLKDLQQSIGLTYLFIGHDLNVVRHISDRIGVMYLGRIVEIAQSEQLFENPIHPYTQALIQSIPSTNLTKDKQVLAIEGEIPSPSDPPSGCAFRTRCPFATDLCKRETPDFVERENRHFVACHYASQLETIDIKKDEVNV